MTGPVVDKTIFNRILRQVGVIVLVAAALGAGVNLLRPNSLPWIEDWSPPARVIQTLGGSNLVSLTEAQKLHQTGRALFLDARPLAFYEFGHIKGAISLPPDQFSLVSPSKLANVDRSALIITYCDGDTCDLSLELAAALQKNGFTQVKVLVNGWSLWEQNNLPTETGPGR